MLQHTVVESRDGGVEREVRGKPDRITVVSSCQVTVLNRSGCLGQKQWTRTDGRTVLHVVVRWLEERRFRWKMQTRQGPELCALHASSLWSIAWQP